MIKHLLKADWIIVHIKLGNDACAPTLTCHLLTNWPTWLLDRDRDVTPQSYAGVCSELPQQHVCVPRVGHVGDLLQVLLALAAVWGQVPGPGPALHRRGDEAEN